MKNGLVLLLIIFLTGHLFGQVNFSAGIKLSYSNVQFLSPSIETTDVRLEVNEFNRKGNARYAIFSDLEFNPRFSSTFELAYSANLSPSYTVTTDKSVKSTSSSFDVWEFTAIANYQALKNVKPFAGLGLWSFQKRDKFIPAFIDMQGDNNAINCFYDTLNKERRAYKSLDNSNNEYLLSAIIGLRFDTGRFNTSVSYDYGLTPFGKYLQIAGQEYDFLQKTNRFTISLGFKIIK